MIDNSNAHSRRAWHPHHTPVARNLNHKGQGSGVGSYGLEGQALVSDGIEARLLPMRRGADVILTVAAVRGSGGRFI